MVWDCPLNKCTTKKPDIAWAVKDTLIHIEIDEQGGSHEDDQNRIIEIHSASNLKNHILIRFNPDSTSDGDVSCFKRANLRNGDKAFRMHEPEWNKRIPVLIENVRDALNEALENKNVTCGKGKLFF